LVQYKSRQEAKTSIANYLECYYNKKRRHLAINYNIPEEYGGITKCRLEMCPRKYTSLSISFYHLIPPKIFLALTKSLNLCNPIHITVGPGSSSFLLLRYPPNWAIKFNMSFNVIGISGGFL
jgi:hypothetical protein